MIDKTVCIEFAKAGICFAMLDFGLPETKTAKKGLRIKTNFLRAILKSRIKGYKLMKKLKNG